MRCFHHRAQIGLREEPVKGYPVGNPQGLRFGLNLVVKSVLADDIQMHIRAITGNDRKGAQQGRLVLNSIEAADVHKSSGALGRPGRGRSTRPHFQIDTEWQTLCRDAKFRERRHHRGAGCGDHRGSAQYPPLTNTPPPSQPSTIAYVFEREQLDPGHMYQGRDTEHPSRGNRDQPTISGEERLNKAKRCGSMLSANRLHGTHPSPAVANVVDSGTEEFPFLWSILLIECIDVQFVPHRQPFDKRKQYRNHTARPRSINATGNNECHFHRVALARTSVCAEF